MALIIERASPSQVQFETRLSEQVSATAERGEGGGRGRGNRLTCGVPRIFDLADLYAGLDKAPSPELAKEMESHEFWLVRLVFTLHDARSSAVSWLEFHVALDYLVGTPDGAAPAFPSSSPIVHDLFPLRETDKVKAKRTNQLSAKLTFEPIAEGSAESALVLEYERLIPIITAYGKRESAVYWRFLPGAAGNAVQPGIKEMDMIVRRDPGRRVQCTIEVRGAGRRWGLFPDSVAPAERTFTL